jgi:hypothetical protein
MGAVWALPLQVVRLNGVVVIATHRHARNARSLVTVDSAASIADSMLSFPASSRLTRGDDVSEHAEASTDGRRLDQKRSP